ncbi:MAG: transferase, partial [Acidimicrobiales bacterium]|nr:transferase [Acidimicrobiales bacterium]
MSSRRLQLAWRRVANEAINRGWERVRVLGAIAPGTARAERFGSMGPGSVIAFPTATLYGEGSIHIGDGTMVSTWVTLAAGYSPEQTTVPARALVIGDRVVIGLRCGIIAHESIVIGDDVWFGQEVFVTDANHGYHDPEVPIGKQLGPHQSVVIGEGSWIGHGAVVLPGTRIGRQVVVAAGSVVRGEVPDHSVVAGVPARVVRQYRPGQGWPRVHAPLDADGLPVGLDDVDVADETMIPAAERLATGPEDEATAAELEALEAELARHRRPRPAPAPR